MKDGVKARDTLEFKREAVRLVHVGEKMSAVARTLGVSGQSLDNWIKAEAAGRLRDVRGKAVTAEQMEIARLWRELAARGIRAGKERVRRMMKSLGLQARGKRRFKATTNSAHDFPVAPNLLARNFSADAPNKVWTGDITYIWTQEGWLYLAVVIDLFNRQVVGFAMGERMTRTLVMDALRMAWFRRHPAPGLIFHSDRGSQYASNDYRQLLRDFKMESSMSRKGDCWDNAVTETLFGSLKVERLHGMRFGTRRQAKDEVMDWIAFYNHRRLHSTLGYASPMAFEQKWLARQISLAA